MRTLSLAVVCLVFSGCVVSASQKYARAPRIANPLDQRIGEPVPGMATTREAFALSSFDGNSMCFEGASRQDPGAAAVTRYSLKFLETDSLDFKQAPGSVAARVKVLQSSGELVPVMTTTQDMVRDGQGKVVATVERQVPGVERRYQTQVQVCFSDVRSALSPEARFMVLFNDDSQPRGAWGIPMGSRTAWVWRFPKADMSAPAEK